MYAAQSYQYRFADAVTLLCGGQVPSVEMVTAWLDRSQDDSRLQEFAMAHGPEWAQGIALLDAAHVIANSPVEDLPDAEYAEEPPRLAALNGEGIEFVAQWLEKQRTSGPATGPEFANAIRFVGADGVLKGTT